jgi:hypothetical protein
MQRRGLQENTGSEGKRKEKANARRVRIAKVKNSSPPVLFI